MSKPSCCPCFYLYFPLSCWTENIINGLLNGKGKRKKCLFDKFLHLHLNSRVFPAELIFINWEDCGKNRQRRRLSKKAKVNLWFIFKFVTHFFILPWMTLFVFTNLPSVALFAVAFEIITALYDIMTCSLIKLRLTVIQGVLFT